LEDTIVQQLLLANRTVRSPFNLSFYSLYQAVSQIAFMGDHGTPSFRLSSIHDFDSFIIRQTQSSLLDLLGRKDGGRDKFYDVARSGCTSPGGQRLKELKETCKEVSAIDQRARQCHGSATRFGT
jgi:hypothetical protein